MTEKCPVIHGSMTTNSNEKTSNRDWWPEQLNLSILHQHSPASNPLDTNFDYKKAFEQLDYQALKQDLKALMTDSQPWWPADYGHYGPFFIRMAWHAAGTYRTTDGRAGGKTGAQRFAPLNSWPDNGNLDKARRLLWPIKQKYGQNISWADLFLLTGNVAIESMGGPTFGFSGGREDIWAPEEDIYWGVEKNWLTNERYTGDRKLENPLAAVQMGLIYVNPEGPDGNPDPKLSANDIRETFSRMAMNDEETVALVAGGHTFGKAHGAGDPSMVGPDPEAAPIENMGLGWISSYNSGCGRDTITSGIEGSWTTNPTQWDNDYFHLLMDYDWALTKSPAGAHIWHMVDGKREHQAPDAEDASTRVPVMMTTADMALKEDSDYCRISQHFRDHPEAFANAFARAWFKLLHRDMGPQKGYIGPEAPTEDLIWQDPVPDGNQNYDIDGLKSTLLSCGLSAQVMIETAWASASTFRGSDRRGGANGARIRLAPQKHWAVNKPEQLSKTLAVYELIAKDSGASVADIIVLAGTAALEKAMGESIPFTAGRGDASAEQTDAPSFDVLEPHADAFRNYLSDSVSRVNPEEMMLDRAQLLGLSAPQMTALIGGLRGLGIGREESTALSDVSNQFNNTFFTKLLDMRYSWKACGNNQYIAIDRSSGESVGHVSRSDLIFGSNSQLRALAEVYAASDGHARLSQEFIQAWTQVMNADLIS